MLTLQLKTTRIIVINNINNIIFQPHSARVRQLKRTELAYELEALNASALPTNCKFAGTPNARIVRRSRSFDRREIRTSWRDREKYTT